ncbi:MAG: amidohydrolase [Oscillospiraceae bacterium]|jgi:predicted TIM-barrel fold metal-dependent hydrolase|nr:amidohydrolase [Oscillospiraceae bacterium]
MSEHSVWEDGFFKIDPECHIIGDMSSVEHFPGVQMWWRAIDGIMRPTLQGAPGDYISKFEPWEMTKSADPENILRAMDKYGVDVACILPESMMDTTGFTSRWCTNGDAWKAVQTHPDRFILNPNLSPIKRRGVKNAIWELEYWMDQGAKIFKYYSPEDTYINDPELWPFYKRAEELGAVLCLHTGFSWVPPGKSKYCYPPQVDDVARDFPELKIVAFHMGYPFTDAMNMVALGHPNVYLCLSLLVPWAVTAPYKFAHILGEAMRFVGPDRIIWGTDSAGYGLQIGMAAMGLAQFQIPDELQCKYGYLPLTDEDKRKIFGGNLGKLLGIDTTHRRGGKASEEAPQERPLEMISQVQRPAEASVTAVADRSVLPATEEFEVVMSTPIGSINGKVITHIEGERISGVISFMGQENEFKNGIIDESGNVTFSGEMKTPIGKMAYTSTGKMVDGKIEAVAKTKLGNIEIRSK